MNENEERNDLIADIEFLYPPNYSVEGRDLLIQALCIEWKSLPMEILRTLKSLNVQKDRLG